MRDANRVLVRLGYAFFFFRLVFFAAFFAAAFVFDLAFFAMLPS